MSGYLFCDSFDHYTTVTDKWTSSYLSPASGGNPSTTTIGAYGRGGTNGLQCHIGGAATVIAAASSLLSRGLNAALTTGYIGLAYNTDTIDLNSNRSILGIRDGNVVQLVVVLRTDGSIDIRRGDSTTHIDDAVSGLTVLGTSGIALQENNWYYIELKFVLNDSTGVVVVRVNETEIINETNIDTDNTGTGIATSFYVGGGRCGGIHSGGNVYIDDVTVRDDQFSGDVQVRAMLPNGAGTTTQWTPSTGSNYQNVDEAAPNGDTDYNNTTTVGNKDTYSYPKDLASTGEVHCIAFHYYAKKVDAGSSKICPVVRQGGTDYDLSDLPLTGVEYAYSSHYQMTNPDTSSPFTPSEINDSGAEFGVKKTA